MDLIDHATPVSGFNSIDDQLNEFTSFLNFGSENQDPNDSSQWLSTALRSELLGISEGSHTEPVRVILSGGLATDGHDDAPGLTSALSEPNTYQEEQESVSQRINPTCFLPSLPNICDYLVTDPPLLEPLDLQDEDSLYRFDSLDAPPPLAQRSGFAIAGDAPPPNVAQAVHSRLLPTRATKTRSKRTRISDAATRLLQRQFHKNPYPDDREVSSLGLATKLKARVIKTWFSNTRTRQPKVDRKSSFLLDFASRKLTAIHSCSWFF
jgi:hypothetical protein